MSLYILVAGSLKADPVRRVGAKGDFVTATLRVPTDKGGVLVSTIAFGDEAEQLLQCRAGDALTISGRGQLTEWVGHDGQQRHGLSVVAEQIATARPRPRKGRQQQRSRRPSGAAAGSAPCLDDPLDDFWPKGVP